MPFIFKDISISLGEIKERNEKLEKLYNWPKGQIVKKIGIKRRHIASTKQTTSLLAKKALSVISKRNDLSNVRFIIAVTNTPTKVFPSLAHEVGSLINTNKDFMCIGINSGCTGYVDAMCIADKFLKKNEDVLIVTADTYSKHIDLNDKSIKPIFSDGASCTLLKFKKNKSWKVDNNLFQTKKNTLKFLEFDKNKIRMNGPEVLSFAIGNVVNSMLKLLTRKKTLIFMHQAGKIVLDIIKSKIKSKVTIPLNYENNGNLVSTSIPLLIKENFSLINKNQNILISGFGVGLSQSHILLKKVK